MDIVTLTTDYGTKDSYVAEVKAVLLHVMGIQILDITHQVPAFDIEQGAFQLWRSYHHFPKGTWHLAIVDPGVGTRRSCVYIRTKNYHFVGPDNGLLTWAVRDAEGVDGIGEYFMIPVPPATGATFHGRDVFAPFIASSLGKVEPPKTAIPTIQGAPFPKFERIGNSLKGRVVAIDHFGNVLTNVPCQEKFQYAIVGTSRLTQADCYASIAPGAASLVAGSHGFWEVSMKETSAANRFDLKKGDIIKFFLL